MFDDLKVQKYGCTNAEMESKRNLKSWFWSLNLPSQQAIKGVLLLST